MTQHREGQTALRARGFTESVIRKMTRVAREHGATNLAQGFPDFPAPDVLKRAACAAIEADINQYAITWGTTRLREALAKRYRDRYGMDVDADAHVTVTCGATEAMASIALALINPGDEVIVFEPFYENYGPDAVLAGAIPSFVTLKPPGFRIEAEPLRAAITSRTRAIILNTPNNPTGRVFDAAEMEVVRSVAIEHDLLVITDEIYEYILYEGTHVPFATLDGMAERTVTVSGLSKTFAITGWRIGSVVAPPQLTDAIRKVHDFLTVGAPAPLQEACAVGLETLDDSYFDGLAVQYGARREVMYDALTSAGFSCQKPQGAYYILADYSGLSDLDSAEFAVELAKTGGVATVPGSSFFGPESPEPYLTRFAFCKRTETLEKAAEQLRQYAKAGV